MTCCCCGAYVAGGYRQHWNRDTGYSICAACIAWLRGRGVTDAELATLYGVAGVNYPGPEVMP